MNDVTTHAGRLPGGRPTERDALYNPAFIALILANAAAEHEARADSGLPFSPGFSPPRSCCMAPPATHFRGRPEARWRSGSKSTRFSAPDLDVVLPASSQPSARAYAMGSAAAPSG